MGERAHTPGRERPILFSAPMVRALLDGRKTQTRRIIKPQPEMTSTGYWHVRWQVGGGCFVPTTAPDALLQGEILDGLRIQVGDRLWVRESLRVTSNDQGVRWLSYAADGADICPTTQWTKERNSVPSIHMPRWASRLTLTVTDVRVQRLQEISEEDAVAEGIEPEEGYWRDYMMPVTQICVRAADSYRTLWDSINGAGSWETNPWVSAIAFDVKKGNIDAL